jgi:hypothetical protein
MSELEKLVRENRAPKELAEAVKTGEKKSRAVSVRMEEPLFRAIEAQAKVWNEKPAETVRAILRFYFLPAVYEAEVKEKTSALLKAELTAERTGEYLNFLLEVLEKIGKVIEFLKPELKRLRELMNEKLNVGLEEEREGAEP